MITEARVGLIIPSGNRLAEPQFNRYMPPEVGVHVARLRMTGKFRKPLGELQKSVAEAAEALDCSVGTISSRLNRARSLLARRLRVGGMAPHTSRDTGQKRCLA